MFQPMGTPAPGSTEDRCDYHQQAACLVVYKRSPDGHVAKTATNGLILSLIFGSTQTKANEHR